MQCINSISLLILRLSLVIVVVYSFKVSHYQSKRKNTPDSIKIAKYMLNPLSIFTSSSSSSKNTAMKGSFLSAPSWKELDSLLKSLEPVEERQNFEDQLNGRGTTNSQSLQRLFDAILPEDKELDPEIILYRDSAAWCPYCEKVWLQLEEKQIPYKIIKIPLRCYGEKPASFMRLNRNGGLPVATIKGQTISESNDIIDLIEKTFPDKNPLWPPKGSEKAQRVSELLSLERKVFSTWFQWLTSRAEKTAIDSMDYYLRLVDQELAVDSSGPYFLGEFSLVDIMFTPFLERMAASLPYFKGFESRSPKYPNLLKWYEVMDQRPTYQGIKSDYYTHCHDLPPQIGPCYSLPAATKFAKEIDGEAWSITRNPSSLLEPMIPLDENIAKREVVRRSIHNREKLVPFALRAVGERGQPPVSAPLADPNARPDLSYESAVDSSLRMILFAMLQGPEQTISIIRTDLQSSQISDRSETIIPKEAIIASLLYMRDRIGCPRDMSIHAARQFRSHINWFINSLA